MLSRVLVLKDHRKNGWDSSEGRSCCTSGLVPGKQDILAPLSLYLSPSTATDDSGFDVLVTSFSIEPCHSNVNVRLWDASKKVLSVSSSDFECWLLRMVFTWTCFAASWNLHRFLHPLCLGFLCKKKKLLYILKKEFLAYKNAGCWNAFLKCLLC